MNVHSKLKIASSVRDLSHGTAELQPLPSFHPLKIMNVPMLLC
jgi:hypothetical protein